MEHANGPPPIMNSQASSPVLSKKNDVKDGADVVVSAAMGGKPDLIVGRKSTRGHTDSERVCRSPRLQRAQRCDRGEHFLDCSWWSEKGTLY